MVESNWEKRHREQMARLMKSIMPDVSRTLRDIQRTQFDIANIGKLYTSKHQEVIEQAKSLAGLSATKFDIPALKLDYRSLFPDLAAIQRDALKSVLPSIELIQQFQRDQFADVIKAAKSMARAGLPPNWRDETVPIPTDLEAMLLDEGLALAWVPPTHVVKKLFAARSAQQRRRLVGSHWKTITKACVAELETVSDSALAEDVEFALIAARTLRDGNPEAAQALSANLLDTILRKNFDKSTLKTITGQKARMDIDEYPLRVAIVIGGIWGSFGEFWASDGDLIPRNYSRHGSAHAVSRRQYSRINSVLALMHVVSLIRLLETDLATSS